MRRIVSGSVSWWGHYHPENSKIEVVRRGVYDMGWTLTHESIHSLQPSGWTEQQAEDDVTAWLQKCWVD